MQRGRFLSPSDPPPVLPIYRPTYPPPFLFALVRLFHAVYTAYRYFQPSQANKVAAACHTARARESQTDAELHRSTHCMIVLLIHAATPRVPGTVVKRALSTPAAPGSPASALGLNVFHLLGDIAARHRSHGSISDCSVTLKAQLRLPVAPERPIRDRIASCMFAKRFTQHEKTPAKRKWRNSNPDPTRSASLTVQSVLLSCVVGTMLSWDSDNSQPMMNMAPELS